MKLLWHKLRHWEYWPVYIVYMPTFFLWLWYMLKYRSLKFYSLSNPGIANGGFHDDSKMATYQLLPQGSYPRTIRIQKNETYDWADMLSKHDFTFPLIVKPDIGCRGKGVQKINSIDELSLYNLQSIQDFLIQEMIVFPNEIGLFYCRMPNEKHGKITGITRKVFLTVEGNGVDSIEQLMRKDPRHEMQIAVLKQEINLSEVLPAGVSKCLVPYGNHSRGTTFLNGQELITDKLEQMIDGILGKVAGFQYGRLDLRFNTFEELEQGLNFSIIEVNGAKSEPTHIYDPKQSFWFGQQEIFRHQRLFSRVIKVNSMNRILPNQQPA